MHQHFKNHGHCEQHPRKHLIWGVMLIIAGCVLLGDRLGIVQANLAWHFWPVLVGVVGLVGIVSARKFSHIVKGCFYIMLALWLYVCSEHLWGWTYSTSWPIIVIAYGIGMVLRGRMGSSAKSDKESIL